MNSFFQRALLRKGSPYEAVLPYNLNWMLRDGDPLLERALDEPVTLVDVGCRGGLPDELWPIRRMIHHIGFDADPQECARLSAEKHDLRARSLHPVFVGGEDGGAEFHLYKSRGLSSALRPEPRYAELIGGPLFAVDETIPVNTTKLDTFFAANPDLPRPDIIKLDTQGTELEILKGATRCLETCSVVEVEVEFFPAYQRQALFHEVMGFMLGQGFELLYLNRVFCQRRGFEGFSRGQITFGDALFARREDRIDGFDTRRLMRFAILLINFGHLDFVRNLVATGHFSGEDKAFLEAYLKGRCDRWSIRQLKKKVVPFLDKFILALLHWRRHNSMAYDSDRSWPFR